MHEPGNDSKTVLSLEEFKGYLLPNLPFSLSPQKNKQNQQ